MSVTSLGMPAVRPVHGQGNLHAQVAFPKAAKKELQNKQMRANIRHATHTIRGKRARVVEELPDSAVVGLRVYGATATSQDAKATQCTDSQLTVPIGPIDRAEMTSSIDSFTGQAATPIGYALEHGAKDLGTDGKRNIVLVSDGLSNCDPPPCPTVQRLVENGVNIQVDTVGYGLDPTKAGDEDARDELKCIAKETNGTIVKATVKEVDAKGATISLADGVEGYLAARDISADRVEDASHVLKVGDEVEAKIIGNDRKSRVMQLSIRAKDQDEMNESLAEYNRNAAEASSGTTKLGALLREQLQSVATGVAAAPPPGGTNGAN